MHILHTLAWIGAGCRIFDLGLGLGIIGVGGLIPAKTVGEELEGRVIVLDFNREGVAGDAAAQ